MAVNYSVKIKHKREYDAEQAGHTTTTPHYADGDGNLGTNPLSAPGSIVYYGDDPITPDDKSWVYFTTAGTPTPREARPIEIIRSYGQSNGSLAVVEVEIKKIALNIATEAAIYAKDTVTSNGTVSIDGHDQAGTVGAVDCGGVSEGSKPPFYTSPSGTTVTLNGTSNILAGPDTGGWVRLARTDPGHRHHDVQRRGAGCQYNRRGPGQPDGCNERGSGNTI